MIEEFEDFILVNKKPGENFHSEFGEEGLFVETSLVGVVGMEGAERTAA